MASVFSHAVAALGIGACFYRPGTPPRVWMAGVACSVMPDLDVIGFRFGIRYGDFWGHRGFTHSLLFAALLATPMAFIGFWRRLPSIGRVPLWSYLFLAAASHGSERTSVDLASGGRPCSRSPDRPTARKLKADSAMISIAN